MKLRNYNLLIVQDKKPEIMEFGIRYSRLIPLVAGGAALLLVAVYFGVGFLTEVFYGQRIEELRHKNSYLSERLTSLSSRIERMQGTVKAIEAQDDAIRTYADMPALDKDIREVGVGGSPRGNSMRLEFLLPTNEESLSGMELDLDKIERALNLERKSLEEIYSRVENDIDKFYHTPSIRPTHEGYLNDGFGYRRDPFTRQKRMHKGLDISTRRGRPVFATADGTVERAGYSPTWGWNVRLAHGYGYDTRYAHLSKVLVKRNQKVKRGQKIGEVGSTGRSTSPHLHYEVRLNGRHRNPLSYFLSDDNS